MKYHFLFNREIGSVWAAVNLCALIVFLSFGLGPVAVSANIDPAEDIIATIPLKPSAPNGQFPKPGDDERLSPNYTFIVLVDITEQEQIGNALWVRQGPVTAMPATPDPNLFWVNVANTTMYHLTNTAQTTGLATLEVSCKWRRQAGGGGQGAAAEKSGRADVVLDLLDSVVHWDFGKTIAYADGEQELTFSYKLLDEAGRGLERWALFAYWAEDPDSGVVHWDFTDEDGDDAWERVVEVTGDVAALATIRLDYDDGSYQVRDSENQHLTFFTAELKVEANEVEDATTVTLGKSLKLSADIVPESFEPEFYRFEASYTDQHDFWSFQSGLEAIYDDFARIAGYFDLRLVVHFNDDDDVYATDLNPLEVQFPSYTEIVTDGPVGFFDDLWQRTLDAANETGRREFGGWIRYNSETLQYETIELPPGPIVANDTHAYIIPGPTPDDTPAPLSTLSPIADGAVYTVAFFHTHTPVTYRVLPPGAEPDDAYRIVGPSQGDIGFHNSRKIPGVVYDYVPEHDNPKRVDYGYPKSSQEMLYPVEPYDRRPTPDIHP